MTHCSSPIGMSSPHRNRLQARQEHAVPASHRTRMRHDHHKLVLFKVMQRDARKDVSLHDWAPRLDWLAPIKIEVLY